MLSPLGGGGAGDVIVAVDSDAVDREAGCAEAGVDSSSGIAVVCCPRVGPVVVEPLCFVSFFLLFFPFILTVALFRRSLILFSLFVIAKRPNSRRGGRRESPFLKGLAKQQVVSAVAWRSLSSFFFHSA